MIMAETIKIICHPNTSGQLFTAKVELYHRYGVHSIVIWHYIYLCCRAQLKCLRYRPCGLVYINTSGRTCLQELFIEYEQITAWVARFFFQAKWRQIIIYYQPLSALGGSMGRRTSRRHYSLVNFKSPVGRNHWPSC